jgi:hypothetical protein
MNCFPRTYRKVTNKCEVRARKYRKTIIRETRGRVGICWNYERNPSGNTAQRFRRGMARARARDSQPRPSRRRLTPVSKGLP